MLASPEKEPPKDIKIGQVTFEGGGTNFVDNSVKPEFDDDACVGPFRRANTFADVDLRGKLNDYAPLPGHRQDQSFEK